MEAFPSYSLVVSMYDLQRHPEFKKVREESKSWKKKYDSDPDKPKWLNAMLWKMGLNYHKNYDKMKCIHIAPLSQKRVKCDRYYGVERTDKEWKDFKEKLYQRDLYADVDSRTFIKGR